MQTPKIIFVLVLALAAPLAIAACGGSTAPATPFNLSPIELQGFDLFNIHCATCHSTAPETIIVGPSLDGLMARAGTRVEGQTADAYLRNSMLNPYDYIVEGYAETMPPDLGKRLTGEEFDAILAYLLTLK